jgi:hypothetical protein
MAIQANYKVDLRWPGPAGGGTQSSHGRVTDRTATDDEDLALSAYRKLLRRDDLAGQPVAARFVVGGRSLYFSQFDKPFGKGRIHPDAPLDASASPDAASQAAAWTP